MTKYHVCSLESTKGIEHWLNSLREVGFGMKVESAFAVGEKIYLIVAKWELKDSREPFKGLDISQPETWTEPSIEIEAVENSGDNE